MKNKIAQLKKYQLQKKVVFWQLVMNFATFQRNNTAFMEKIAHLKNVS